MSNFVDFLKKQSWGLGILLTETWARSTVPETPALTEKSAPDARVFLTATAKSLLALPVSQLVLAAIAVEAST